MRRVRFVLIVSLLFLSGEVFAQAVTEAWVARYNGPGDSNDVATSLTVDQYGNVYVTGQSWGGASMMDIVTIKYSPAGETLWLRRYNGPDNLNDMHIEQAYAQREIAVDDSGNVYVVGMTRTSSAGDDILTIKYKPNGDMAWVRTYNGPANLDDWARGLKVDSLGNAVVTGRSFPSSFVTIKYLSNGDMAWVRTPVGDGVAVDMDGNGNVLVTGSAFGGASDYDFTTIKYSPAGDTFWVRNYNGPGNGYDSPLALAVDDSGYVYVTGAGVGIGTCADFTTIKYTPSGDTVWVRTYDGPGNYGNCADDDIPREIVVDDSGNVIITGSSFDTTSWYDYVTIKYEPIGDTAWVRRYDGPDGNDDFARALAVDDSGNIYVTGNAEIFGSNDDYITIKYNSNGSLMWLMQYNADGEDANDLAIDNQRNVLVTGWSNIVGNDKDFATVKYSQYPWPLIVQAFSPIDCIVTDPSGDSISYNFNTIPGATYTAANDSMYIPQAEIGTYKIRVVRDLLDQSGDTSYTIEARIDGTKDQLIAKDQPVPDTGESRTFYFTSDAEKLYCIAKPGDVNGITAIALPDVIHLVNYVFDKDRPLIGCLGSEWGNCWTPGPLCRGDVNGSGENPNLPDVIYLVNYVFDKDRPANSCLGSDPGNCWMPVSSSVCCLPVP